MRRIDGRVALIAVAAILAVGIALIGAALILRRGEPANTGPPPTLPDYAPPTSLAPQNEFTATTQGGLDGGSTSVPPSTTTIPLGPVTTVGALASDDFESLQDAIDAAESGDTIEVRGGEFEAIVIRHVGTADEWLRVVAAPGTRPVVRAQGAGTSAVEFDGAGFVEISGFEMVGVPESRDGAGVRIVNGSHHIRIADNVVHDSAGNGVEIIEAGTVAIVNNTIYGNSRRSAFQTSGISFFKPFGDDGDGFENIVSGNVVYDNENLVPNDVHGITDGNCVIIDFGRWPDGSYEYPGDTIIENNLCFDNGGRGVHVLHSDDVYVVNNTLYRNLRTESINGGELSADNARNVLFRNNLVWPREEDERTWLVASESVGFDTNMYVLPDGSSDDVDDTDRVVADARLMNPSLDIESADFTPRASSPAVGSGSPEDAPSVDLSGSPRSTTPSIGALEPL